jgi:hypothetical protein
MNELTTIRWFDTKKKAWSTDYINTDDEDNHYVISRLPETSGAFSKYKAVMSRHMAGDLYANLEQIMRNVFRQGGSLRQKFKIINLGVNGMSCDSPYVSIRFEILKQ